MAYCVPLGIPHSRFKAWDPDDQDKAIAYRRELSARCSSCGTRRDEWEEDDTAYVVHTEQCPGCEQIEMEHERLREDDHGEKGIKVHLLPREVALSLLDAQQQRDE